MTRLPYVEPDVLEADEIRLRRNGELRPLDKILLNSPPVAGGWNTYLRAIREKTQLDGRVRELLILRVAVLTDCAYEWDAHVAVARKLGVDDLEIEAVRSGNAAHSSADLGLLIRVADSITVRTMLDGAVYGELKERFNDQEILELVVTVATYNMVSRVLNALEIS